ncbi:MAG: DUF6152 family protein [Armatimonadota bacterium]|nr:DUF6152 family protein [Armatimonadota bacterium]
MRTRVTLTIAVVTAALTIATAVADAHHGWGGYDSTKPLNLTGVIDESSYEHPHGMIKLKVENKTWEVVLAPPSRMQVRGLTKEMLAPGTRVTVMGYPHRNTPDEMRAERITIAGKTTELR